MVQVFDNEMFGALRVVVTDDQKTLFNLADVCRALTLANTARTRQRLVERGITIVNTPTTNQHGAVVMQGCATGHSSATITPHCRTDMTADGTSASRSTRMS